MYNRKINSFCYYDLCSGYNILVVRFFVNNVKFFLYGKILM